MHIALSKLFKTAVVLGILLSAKVLAGSITYKSLRGEETKKYCTEFAALCHQIFAEYPYLYNGEDEGYESYISSYGNSPNSIVCLAFDGSKIIGACAGIPLDESRDCYQVPFLNQGLGLESFFYIGELILLKNYRGVGIGEKLYNQLESIVLKDGLYSKMTCCNIQVAKNDPRAPKDYKHIEYPLWIKLGFKKCLDISYDSFWVNIGEKEESPHRLVFWIKEL